MPELNDILTEKLNRLEGVPDKFIKAVESAQKDLLADINLILGEFERDGGGYLVTSEGNLQRVQALRARLEQVFMQSNYVKAVRSLMQEFDKQNELNAEYYKALDDYDQSAVLKTMQQTSKRQSANLLLGGAIDKEFYNPIIDTIVESVNTNAPFTETVSAVKVITAGGEHAGGRIVEGRLARYAKQIAYDAMAVQDRSFSRQVADEQDYQFFMYTGGTVEDTRDFCLERNGNVYHRNEIADWANLTWDGKHRETTSGSIFVLLGGYQCKHTLMSVPLSQVPIDVLQRNLSNGNISLNDRQKEILGLA